jgi:hypothetical protein
MCLTNQTNSCIGCRQSAVVPWSKNTAVYGEVTTKNTVIRNHRPEYLKLLIFTLQELEKYVVSKIQCNKVKQSKLQTA